MNNKTDIGTICPNCGANLTWHDEGALDHLECEGCDYTSAGVMVDSYFVGHIDWWWVLYLRGRPNAAPWAVDTAGWRGVDWDTMFDTSRVLA